MIEALHSLDNHDKWPQHLASMGLVFTILERLLLLRCAPLRLLNLSLRYALFVFDVVADEE